MIPKFKKAARSAAQQALFSLDMPKRTREERNGDAAVAEDDVLNEEEEDDDDDPEDEDYDVHNDEDEKREATLDAKEEGGKRGGTGGAGDSHAQSIKDEIQVLARARRMDSLWEDMKAEEKAMPRKLSAAESVKQVTKNKSGKSTAKRRRIERKARSVLSGIFGSSVAKDIVAKVGARTNDTVENKVLANKGGKKAKQAQKKKKTEAIAAAVAAAAAKVARKTTVTETAKYAGKTITTTRQVFANTGNGAATMSAPGKAKSGSATGLDAALDALKGPTKINTVTKSSMDWESYKDKTGMQDELEQGARDGFLSRKEFLDRVDVRQFEAEKAERQAERITAGRGTST